MKKALIFLVLLLIFAGCAQSETADGSVSVVCTVFPEYDWVREIAGDGVSLTLLAGNGVDLHSYQPTAADVMNISACDLFIYVGGESDKWVNDVLKNRTNEDMQVISLLETLGEHAKAETLTEGMQGELDGALDEHVWLSLKNSEIFVTEIKNALCSLSPENAGVFEQNCENYIAKLRALDEKYSDEFANAENRTLIFADRFPFRYLADDYGLTCFAAFPGCSAESEASFETVAFLAKKLAELKLSHIMILEGSDGRLASAVISAAKAENAVGILYLDSMQSVTHEDISSGISYLSVMEHNLETIKYALS